MGFCFSSTWGLYIPVQLPRKLSFFWNPGKIGFMYHTGLWKKSNGTESRHTLLLSLLHFTSFSQKLYLSSAERIFVFKPSHLYVVSCSVTKEHFLCALCDRSSVRYTDSVLNKILLLSKQAPWLATDFKNWLRQA